MPLPHIQIGDDLLDDALLASVIVVQGLNRHWTCTVDCRQTSDRPIPVEQLIGQTVVVKTIDEQGTKHLQFQGFILGVEQLAETWGSFGARLRAVSFSHALDLAPRKQGYPAQTLAQVAATAAGYAGLSASVDAPAGKPLNYVQYGETDFAFLSRIVDDHAAWLRPSIQPDDPGLEIFASFQPGSTVVWRDHDGLLDFSVKARLAPASASGSHYDHHAMASKTFTALATPPSFYSSAAPLVAAAQAQSASLLPASFEPQRARAMTLAEYELQLHAESVRSLGSSVTGRGRSRNQTLTAGNTVTIEGPLDLAGTYGLTEVTHTWLPGGYSNAFLCTPWKHYRNPTPPPHREWQGIVPARVVAHNDPKKMGRLQVQFFWQTDGATHWARATSPHAGPDRGFMFMPEVGDEVAVAFEDGDPERPLILGSLWNGVHQAPRAGFFAPTEDIPDNNVKRILTKSGNRLQMIDKPGNETVMFATPHHTVLSMTEKHDATTRSLIAIRSDGDIILSAPNGRVHIQSQTFSREVAKPASAPAAPHLVNAVDYPSAPSTNAMSADSAAEDTNSDGCLLGRDCQPLTKKLKPGERLSSQHISKAWNSAYLSNSPCCQAQRAGIRAPKKLIYINGIQTTKQGQCSTLRKIADQTCAQVLGVHNATEGFVKDSGQTFVDRTLIERAREGRSFKTHDGRNPAVDSTTDLIANSVTESDPTEFAAHSQGGDILALASNQSNTELINGGVEQGVSGVQVTTMASAGQSYPQTLSGEHYVNIQDYVPTDLGLTKDPRDDVANTGPDQHVYRFEMQPGEDPVFMSDQEMRDMISHTSIGDNDRNFIRKEDNSPATHPTKYHGLDMYLQAYKKKHGGC